MTQMTQLNSKILFGSVNLSQFLISEFLVQLQRDPKLELTVKALENNLNVLANPIVDVEHDHNHVTINVLTLVPEILDKESFCTIEHLTPLKFNISNTCLQRSIKQTELALITCPLSKHVISTITLDKCFVSDYSVLCTTNILQVVNEVEWLGFPWSSGVRLTYPYHMSYQYHVAAKDCEGLHPFVNLGGRCYLSTTSGTIKTNIGTLWYDH